jgi:hypothetical protein
MMQDNRSNGQALAGLFDTDMLMSDEFSRGKKERELLQAPTSLWEQMDERHGKLKSRFGLFGHLLGGGTVDDYGDADLVSQYTADKQAYDMQQKIAGFGQIMPFINDQIGFMQDDDPTNDAAATFALGQAGVDKNMMEMMFPGMDKTSSELPDATRAVIHYQDSLNRYVDEDTGEVMMRKPGDKGYVKYADAFDRYKNRELGGLREQAAAKASGASAGAHGQEIINKAPSEAATMNSAMNAITNMGNITYDDQGMPVFTPREEYAEDFDDVYGTLDRFKPFSFSEGEEFVNSTIEQIQGILAVDARGKLKGQGQISDSETAMLEKSLTILKSKGISPEEAKREIARIYHVMEKGMRQKQEVINQSQGNSPSRNTGGGDDFDALWDGA